MISESRRAAIRISTNYVRLFLAVLLGLALTRLLLHKVGSEAFGLISLIGSTVGFTILLEEIVGGSMIREVGIVLHSGDEMQFRRMYNSAIAVSALGAAITLAAFGILLAVLPLLEISQALLPAARWFVMAKAIESAAMVLLAPQYNMYLITERMVRYNAWFVARRASLVLAAALLYWLRPADQSQGLIWYGWLSCGLQILAFIGSSLMIMAIDPRLIPAPSLASRDGINSMLRISGWNLAILISKMMGLPAGAVIMNLAFGLHGNLIFGLAMQFAGYARMLASGMTGGIDAVSARLSSMASADVVTHSMQRLIKYSTRLHALVAFPAAIGMGILARPFLELWVGSSFRDDPQGIVQTVALVRVLLIGFAIMCLSDNWIRILYGAGHIGRYARVVVGSGLAVPLLAVALLWSLPRAYQFTAVAWAFSLSYLIIHLGVIPRITAKVFDIPILAIFAALLRPLCLGVICSPLLLVFLKSIGHWTIWWLAGSAIPYSIVYGLLSWFYVLDQMERKKLTAAGAKLGLPVRVPAPEKMY